MLPMRLPLPTAKKAQKCNYLTAGLREIIGVRNKKLHNNVTYAKFERNSKNDRKFL